MICPDPESRACSYLSSRPYFISYSSLQWWNPGKADKHFQTCSVASVGGSASAISVRISSADKSRSSGPSLACQITLHSLQTHV